MEAKIKTDITQGDPLYLAITEGQEVRVRLLDGEIVAELYDLRDDYEAPEFLLGCSKNQEGGMLLYPRP
jgi:hypothetical protein